MDYCEPCNIEFLDLTGVDEEERNRVLSSLYSWDPNVKLPWKYTVNQHPQQDSHPIVRQKDVNQNSYNNPNVVLTSNININENNCVAPVQQYPVYFQGYIPPSGYITYPATNELCQQINPAICIDRNNQSQPIVYYNENYTRPIKNQLGPAYLQHMPNTAHTYIVNDIKYAHNTDNSKTFINNKVEVKQDFSNKIINQQEYVPNNAEPVHSALKQSNSATVRNGITHAEVINKTNEQQLVNCNVNNQYEQKKESLEECVNVTQSVLSNETDFSTPENGTEVSTPNETTHNKSWASLFNKPKTGPVSSTTAENDCKIPLATVSPFVKASINSDIINNCDTSSPIKEPHLSDFDDPHYYRMGEYLSGHNIDNRIISLQPRGLINRSNYCYINSILQALLACPPVYNLLCGLSEHISSDKKKITPIIDGMSRFVKEFHHLPAGMRVGRRTDKNQKKEHNININCDTPFEPSWIYKMLSDTFVIEGRQEDAEEFLGCLLNGLNDEMLELIKLVTKSTGIKIVKEEIPKQNDLDKEWQVMGPKNKGSITRRTEFGKTPISNIFGGFLRSRVHRATDLPTDNIQPFFTLPLNIEKATTVQEALEFLISKNQLEGVTSSKTNQEVEAWQQVTIEELPVVLVLHLKCFDYKIDGCTKIIKALEFPIDLKIDSKLLSSKTNSTTKEKQYKLFAVVYHDGKETSKGHYVTDAYHVGYASWLRYDDASVKPVQEEHVLKPQGTRVPYLLFYRRSDSIRSK